MDAFVSTFEGRIDAKGRVSLPAAFRAVLKDDGFKGLFCTPSLDGPALDAGGNRLLKMLRTTLDGLNPLGADHDLLSAALFGRSDVLKIDADGRMILTDALKFHAQITDHIVFVGAGHKFFMFSPAHHERYLHHAVERVKLLRHVREGGAQ